MPGKTTEAQAASPLATPDEVAAFLRKPPKTLAEWRSRGLGPRYFKIGRDVRYDWAAVHEWLADQAAEARSA
jgi:predicted DNA-binding transcriptional regulator AlpA